jgi:hypothetical protein
MALREAVAEHLWAAAERYPRTMNKKAARRQGVQ